MRIFYLTFVFSGVYFSVFMIYVLQVILSFMAMKDGIPGYINLSKRAQICAFLLCAVVGAPCFSRAFSQDLGFSAGGGVVDFVQLGASSPSTSWSGGFVYTFSDALGAELYAGISHPSRSYDIPGGSQSLNLNSWWVEALIARHLLTIGGVVEVGAHTGIGITGISHDPFSVNAGALGSIIIPEAADSHTHILAGLRLTGGLFGGVAAHVGSDLRLFDPFTSPEAGYSITGGLLIALL